MTGAVQRVAYTLYMTGAVQRVAYTLYMTGAVQRVSYTLYMTGAAQRVAHTLKTVHTMYKTACYLQVFCVCEYISLHEKSAAHGPAPHFGGMEPNAPVSEPSRRH